MLKYFKYLFVILTIVTLSSCSGDEDPAFGSISGRVYDYATHPWQAYMFHCLRAPAHSLPTNRATSCSLHSMPAHTPS